MSPFYINDNKLLINNDELAISSDCCCADRRWLRSHARIGGNDGFEQGWLVTSGQPPGNPYTSGQIPNQNRNAEWMPNSVGVTNVTMHPPTTATQTFYITYDKVARDIRWKLSGANTSGRNPPWPSAESIALVPPNKLTSEIVAYPMRLEVFAIGRRNVFNGVEATTISTGIKWFNCNLQVVGEPVVAIPDTEVTWFRKPDWVPGDTNLGPQVQFLRQLPGYKLGKGFTITGSLSMSWEGLRPFQSFVQGWFAFFDFTNDYIL